MCGIYKAFPFFLLVAVLALSRPVVAAEADSALVAEMSAARVTVVDGKERLTGATESRPGDLLQYTVRYTNKGDHVLRNVVATLPVPAAGMSFVPGTAEPAVMEASLDGRTYARVPLTRMVRLPDGREQRQEVPASEYRYLRWHLGDLAPGANSSVHARLRVNQ